MIEHLRNHPATTGFAGSVFGWMSFDLLRASQIFAGLTAGVVSVLTIFIITPRAIEGAMSIPAKWAEFKAWLAKLFRF